MGEGGAGCPSAAAAMILGRRFPLLGPNLLIWKASTAGHGSRRTAMGLPASLISNAGRLHHINCFKGQHIELGSQQDTVYHAQCVCSVLAGPVHGAEDIT